MIALRAHSRAARVALLAEVDALRAVNPLDPEPVRRDLRRSALSVLRILLPSLVQAGILAPPARMPTTQLPESSIPNDLPAALRIVTSTLWQPASNSSHICMQSSSSEMISVRGTHERREHGIHLHRYSFWPSLRRTLARAATW